jgi:hypothetical protein
MVPPSDILRLGRCHSRPWQSGKRLSLFLYPFFAAPGLFSGPFIAAKSIHVYNIGKGTGEAELHKCRSTIDSLQSYTGKGICFRVLFFRVIFVSYLGEKV